MKTQKTLGNCNTEKITSDDSSIVITNEKIMLPDSPNNPKEVNSNNADNTEVRNRETHDKVTFQESLETSNNIGSTSDKSKLKTTAEIDNNWELLGISHQPSLKMNLYPSIIL